MALNRVSDMSAADWLSQTPVKNEAVIRFFSVVEIPIKHSSLHNKIIGVRLLLNIYADQGITKITRPSSISNAAKKSTDVLIDTEAATKQEPKLVSQLTGKGTRRIEVQRPVIEGNIPAC